MKLTHNKCKNCKKDYLIQKTEFKFYCNGCKTRYKKISKGSLLLLDKPAEHIPIDKSKIVMKAPKKEDPPKPKTDESLKKDMWRQAKKETLAYYNKQMHDPDIPIDQKNEISDMLIQYHRFGSATQFSLRATNLYKLYLTQLNIQNNENNAK